MICLDYSSMERTSLQKVAEAEELLKEVESWSRDKIEELPKLYREKAREYRSRYLNPGDQ